MYFNTYTPSAQLAPFIRSYWILETYGFQGGSETILPDGCMELIFHFGDDIISEIAQNKTEQSGTILVGQIKEAITLQPTGNTGIFAVRFQPWGFYALSGIQADELTEQVFNASDIWGTEIASVEEQLRVLPHESKVRLIEQFFISILEQQQNKVLEKSINITSVLGELYRHIGNIPVVHLAYQSNLSVRQFSRQVTNITGISPKLLARIIRLQHFLKIHTEGQTLTDSLYRCGYYDQAHFIREFKEIANTTPYKFFKDDNTMASLMIL